MFVIKLFLFYNTRDIPVYSQEIPNSTSKFCQLLQLPATGHFFDRSRLLSNKIPHNDEVGSWPRRFSLISSPDNAIFPSRSRIFIAILVDIRARARPRVHTYSRERDTSTNWLPLCRMWPFRLIHLAVIVRFMETVPLETETALFRGREGRKEWKKE